MNRRAQLAAWLVILVLGVGVGYVATIVRPFPEEESPWPLRVRYTVERFPGGSEEDVVTRVHDFSGASWRDWVDVTLPTAEGEPARVSAFDGRTAEGVLAVDASLREPYAALEALDEVRWESVDAVHDQSRAPNDWFNSRFAQRPDAAPQREVTRTLDAWETRWADELGLDPGAVSSLEYWEAVCEEGTLDACGDDVYRYRYVFHEEAGIPLYLEEGHGEMGLTLRMHVEDVELGLDETNAVVAQRRPE